MSQTTVCDIMTNLSLVMTRSYQTGLPVLPTDVLLTIANFAAETQTDFNKAIKFGDLVSAIRICNEESIYKASDLICSLWWSVDSIANRHVSYELKFRIIVVAIQVDGTNIILGLEHLFHAWQSGTSDKLKIGYVLSLMGNQIVRAYIDSLWRTSRDYKGFRQLMDKLKSSAEFYESVRSAEPGASTGVSGLPNFRGAQIDLKLFDRPSTRELRLRAFKLARC